jgi:hypothetical protein
MLQSQRRQRNGVQTAKGNGNGGLVSGTGYGYGYRISDAGSPPFLLVSASFSTPIGLLLSPRQQRHLSHLLQLVHTV